MKSQQKLFRKNGYLGITRFGVYENQKRIYTHVDGNRLPVPIIVVYVGEGRWWEDRLVESTQVAFWVDFVATLCVNRFPTPETP